MPISSTLSFRHLLIALLAGTLSCLYPAYVTFQFVSPADNWELGYCWLISHGLLPYRDIYINVPTLHLNSLNFYFSIVGNSVFTSKIFGLAVRFFLAGATCLICLRFSPAKIAIPAVILGLALHFGDIADPTYNHIALLFAVLALNCDLWNSKRRNWGYALAGFFTALAFLIKYTIGATIGICLMSHLLFEFLQPKGQISLRKMIECAGFFFSSILLTVSAYLLTLWNDNLLDYFIQQVVVQGPQGKGSPWGTILRPWIGLVSNPIYSVSAGLAFPFIWSLCSGDTESSRRTKFAACFIGIFILFGISLTQPFSISGAVWQYVAIYTGFLGCGCLSLRIYYQSWKGRIIQSDQDQGLACFAAFALAYSHALSWPAFEGMIVPSLPLLLCLGYRLGQKGRKLTSPRGFWSFEWTVGVIASLALACSVAKKFQKPWDWYWTESPVYENNFHIDSPFYGNVSMGRDMFELATNFKSIIDKNTTPEDTILIFPVMPEFYAFAERRPATKALSHWFDVCPDSVAREDAKRILAAPPRVVMWRNLDPELISFNEKQFRDGKYSGQRDFIKAFESLKPRYQLVYESTKSSANGVQIYLKKNGN